MHAIQEFLTRIVHLIDWGSGRHRLFDGKIGSRTMGTGYIISMYPAYVFEDTFDHGPISTASTEMVHGIHEVANLLSDGVAWRDVMDKSSIGLASKITIYVQRYNEWKESDILSTPKRLRLAISTSMRSMKSLSQKPKPSTVTDQRHMELYVTEIDALQKQLYKVEYNQWRDMRYQYATSLSTEMDLIHAMAICSTLDISFSVNALGLITSGDGFVHLQMMKIPFRNGVLSRLEIMEGINQSPPDYTKLSQLFQSIHDRLRAMKDHVSDKDVNEIMHMGFIHTLLYTSPMNYDSLLHVMDAIVGIIVRARKNMGVDMSLDQTMNEWNVINYTGNVVQKSSWTARKRVIFSSVNFLLEKMYVTEIDAANAKIRTLEKFVKNHAMDFERMDFDARVKKQTITLQHTINWLERACSIVLRMGPRAISTDYMSIDNLINGTMSPHVTPMHTGIVSNLINGTMSPHFVYTDSESIKNLTEAPIDVFDVFHVGLVDLIVRFIDEGPVCVPETLLIDIHRITMLSSSFHTSVLSYVISLTCQAYLDTISTSTPACIMCNVQRILVETPPRPTHPAYTIRMVLDRMRSDLSDTDIVSLRHIIGHNVQRSSRVHMATVPILKRVWFSATKEFPPAYNNVAFVSGSMDFLLPSMKNDLSNMAAMARYNKKVHGAMYKSIITSQLYE
jgi:hypothetical protein